MKRTIGLVLVAMMLVAGGVTIYASSNTLKELEDLQKAQEAQQRELANKKAEQQRRKNEQNALIREIESQYEVINTRLAEGDQSLQNLYAKIGELELEIVDMNLSIEELEIALQEMEIEINGVKLELQQIRADKDILHQQAIERIRVMYEYGDTGYLEVLLEASDLMDMFSRMEYINRLVEADNELFDTLDRFESDISAKEASLKIYEASLQDLKNDALAEKAILEEKVIVKGLEVEHANELMDTQRAWQASLKEEEGQAEAAIRNIVSQLNAIAEEEARVDRELAETLARKAAEIQRLSGLDFDGGPIMWPVPGWTRISSPFGPRLHPIHKIWKNHNGIDIPASGGTPIIAVASGEVIIAKYSSSYGNYCAVAHGNGYVSLYAHCSSMNVQVGDKVDAGETIARVGTTGWSTGNHLHFGFQKNDVWVDPMSYVN